MRGSKTGRPIMAALDLLGRRWALRILWELRTGALTFRALRDATDGVSPTVLNARLGELKEVGIVACTDQGYALTPSGRKLSKSLVPLYRWSEEWSAGV